MGFLDLGMEEVAKERETGISTKQERLDEITGQTQPSMLDAGNKDETDEAYFMRKDAACVASHGKGYQWDEELEDCSVGR